ncbi:MAG: cytochrome c biogenesis protein CcdA [Candidatus Babeliales bacterium]
MIKFKNNIPKILVAIAAILFIVIVLGLAWLLGVRQQAEVGGTFGFMALLSFASGLSMIVLPCTLPLVFIIVPMAMGKDYLKGFIMALLFGLGISITIMFYGILMALLGNILGIKGLTPWIVLISGLAAYIFGLSEFSFFPLQIPFAATILPKRFQQKGDYIRSFLLGLLLGNAGVGCPNPLFYVLLFYISGTANVLAGSSLGFIHGVGRALPIIFLTILAMFGIQATKPLVQYRFAIKNLSAWFLILIGTFLIPAGLLNLRGWWIFDYPIDFIPWILAIGLLILPIILKFFKKEAL